MKTNKWVGLLGAGLYVSLNLLHAAPLPVSAQPVQSSGVDSAAPPDSIVQVTAEAQGLEPVSPADLPPGGTFWMVTADGVAAPMPCLPNNPNLPVYAITTNGQYLVDATGGQVATAPAPDGLRASSSMVNSALLAQSATVANLISQVQAEQTNQSQTLSLSRSSGMSSPMLLLSNPNVLWLEITNYDGNFAYLNLHNGTNLVYAIWSSTNLLTGWQVETELWPAQAAVYPFAVPTLNRDNLFLRAEDWTGIDSNGDGVPDWWIWLYYGNLIETATNLDAAGHTLGYDYSNSIPPAVFSFTGIEAANNYVNTTLTPVQLDVTGSPYYVAVLVDDTNLNDAVWNVYASSTVSVNLGLTSGWHDVWVGLRGFADAPTNAIWQSKALNLDYTPPTLIITGPTNGTVNVAVLQLTGYSSEALAGISYDLSNAVATVTNQQVLITGQDYDTVNMEYTTNYFHGYDIPLTNGLNVITLHAMDQAGNVATLTTNFTLDYSSKTNPPDVTVTWPPNGASLAGSSFNLTGQVSDPTATVSVQLVDTNGTTNVYSGVVGRDGQFYVMNLPLTGGTNTATLIVQDAVGNTRAALVSLVQSAVNLTINPVAAGQATVTGSVSAGCTVTANGVAASVSGTSWTAQIPPIGLGGGSVTVSALSSTGQTNQIQILVAAPQGVFEQSYHVQQNWTLDPTLGYTNTGTATENWTNGLGGNYSGYVSGELISVSNWPAYSWPDMDYPTGISLEADEDINGNPIWDTNTFEASPPPVGEHGSVSLFSAIRVQRTADTEMMLATGGSPGSTKQNLWVISATAAAHTNLTDTTGEAIPPTQIQIAGLGTLGTDGNLYLLLPDGVTNDVTPKVNGTNDYTFNVWATKYNLAITANGSDLSTNTPQFCVGQKVNLQAVWNPPLPSGTQTSYDWFASLDFINGSLNPATLDGSRYPSIIPVLLATNIAPMWWYSGGYKYVFCSTTNTFQNGQAITITKQGNISIYRPQSSFGVVPVQPIIPMETNGMLELGAYLYGPGAPSFTVLVTSTNNFPGVANWVQLINRDASPSAKFYTTSGQYWLDNDPFYNTDKVGGTNINTDVNPRGIIQFDDNPGISDWLGFESIDDSFQTYLVFKPNPQDTSVWVTLGIVSWAWSASEGNWLLTGSSVVSPYYTDTNSFPLWPHILHTNP